jgi:hypothetical protein
LKCADGLIGRHIQVDGVVDVIDPIGRNEVMLAVGGIIAGELDAIPLVETVPT